MKILIEEKPDEAVGLEENPALISDSVMQNLTGIVA